jgi:ankyrin repeat protein
MPLLSLPNELIEIIAETIQFECDLNALAQTNQSLYNLLNPYLYRFNVQQRGSSAVSWAAERGRPETLQKLIQEGANLNIRVDNHALSQPLLTAAMEGHIGVVKVLLDHGIPPDQIHDPADSEDETGYDQTRLTAMGWAAAGGHTDVFELLLARGADPTWKEPYKKESILMLAVEGGNPDIVRRLIALGCEVDARDSDGVTALARAARYGDVEAAQALINHGADPESRDQRGKTPLFCAAEGGHQTMVEFLLGKGVDPNPRNNDGQSPLSAAAAQDRPTCVALLLEHIDIEHVIAAGGPEAYTVLTSAAAFGHELVVKQLLEKGVDPDSRGATRSEWFVGGRTALSWAAEKGYYGNVHILLDYGAVDLCPEDDDDLPPHILAAGNDHKEIVALLLDRGVNVNMTHTSSGHTALSKAADEYADSVVQLLLERGADPNHQIYDGRTPLALAVIGGNVSLVKMLLDAGADPDSEINWRQYGEDETWTPLQFAAKSSRNEAGAIVKLLFEYSAKCRDIDNISSREVLFAAAKNARAGVVRAFLEQGFCSETEGDAHNRHRLLLCALESTGSREIICLLLEEYGFDVHFQDDEGRTALCWAAMVGNEFEVRLLLTKGADPLHEDKEGHNALFYAIRSANKQATQLLVEYVDARDLKKDYLDNPQVTTVLQEHPDIQKILQSHYWREVYPVPRFSNSIHLGGVLSRLP